MYRLLKLASASILGIFLLFVGVAYFWFSLTLDRLLEPPKATANVDTILRYKNESYTQPGVDESARDERTSLLSSFDTDRPWARWWWPGADVEIDSLLRQLDDLKAVGFGGVEIQPFSLGLLNMSDSATVERVLEFDTPRYYQALDAVMSHADDIGMQVYLNHLSGWPAGGPHVPLEASMHEYLFAEASVGGGKVIEMDVPKPKLGLNAYAMALFEQLRGFDGYNFARGEEKLVSVLAAKKTGGKRNWNPLDGTDTVALDPESVVVLDDYTKDGLLKWEAPQGDWLVVATYLIPSGEPPILVATKQAGFVIDHLDPEMLVAHYNYAFGQRTGLEKHYGNGFTGFFNDSLEYKLDVMSSRDMLEEFKARKGYDLRPYLPLLAIDGADNFYLRDAAQFRTSPNYSYSAIDERIRHDFLSARSDMIIERFVGASADWAEQRGLKSRAQSYGFDLDVIKALGTNQIPETEQLYAGGSEMFLKMASSAGDLYGRDLISSESFVWKARDYALGPKHLKAGTDLLLHSGINQIIYHGVTYQTKDQKNNDEYVETFGDLGWFPWSQPNFDLSFSTNAGPGSPLWQTIPTLNQYITNSQALLRQGKADVDVYIYYPFMGVPTSYGSSNKAIAEFLVNGYLPDEGPESLELELVKLPFFEAAKDTPDRRIAWLERLLPVVTSLNERGVTWRFVNDQGITENLISNGIAEPDGRLPSILLFDTPALELETARALEAGNGTKHQTYFMGSVPDRVPGFKDFIVREALLRPIIAALSQDHVVNSSDELADITRRGVGFAEASAIRRHSRLLANGRQVHFFANQSIERAVAEAIFPMGLSESEMYWFDPMTEKRWAAEADNKSRVMIDLAPLQSLFLLVGEPLDPTPPPIWGEAKYADWVTIDGARWSVLVDGARVDLDNTFADATADDLTKFASKLVYETSVEISGGGRFILDLGDLDGVASVVVNDAKVATVGFPPYIIELSQALRPGVNHLAIELAVPLRNSLVKQALDGRDQYMQNLRHQSELAKGGLKGPVRLGRLR